MPDCACQCMRTRARAHSLELALQFFVFLVSFIVVDSVHIIRHCLQRCVVCHSDISSRCEFWNCFCFFSSLFLLFRDHFFWVLWCNSECTAYTRFAKTKTKQKNFHFNGGGTTNEWQRKLRLTAAAAAAAAHLPQEYFVFFFFHKLIPLLLGNFLDLFAWPHHTLLSNVNVRCNKLIPLNFDRITVHMVRIAHCVPANEKNCPFWHLKSAIARARAPVHASNWPIYLLGAILDQRCVLHVS